MWRRAAESKLIMLPANYVEIATACTRLAATLPNAVIENVAVSLNGKTLGNWSEITSAVVESVSSPHQRNLVTAFVEKWKMCATEASPQAIAIALLSAAIAEKVHRDEICSELVWTGPEIGVAPLRRTEQALLQVIESASQRLLIVSYAVYKIERICNSLIEAADRGVEIKIVVESPDRLEVKNTYSTLAALGPHVSERCSVFLWPLERRATDESGKPGILHVKCAVSDGRHLFLSSANLTEYAFTLNMELGVVMTGNNLAAQVESHFNRMIQSGILSKISD